MSDSEPAAMMYSSPQQATLAEPRLAYHYWIIAAGQEVVEELKKGKKGRKKCQRVEDALLPLVIN